jgi:hypothetical protein
MSIFAGPISFGFVSPYREVFARDFGEAVGLDKDPDMRPTSLPFASKME